MPTGLELTGTNEEWLRRSANASTRLGLPSSIAVVLIATGLAEENVRGTLDISEAGLDYLKIRGISTNIQKRGRPHK